MTKSNTATLTVEGAQPSSKAGVAALIVAGGIATALVAGSKKRREPKKQK